MTDLLTELPQISEDKFRFQNQKCMLTYKTHLNKDDFTAWLNNICPLKTIYIAHEMGTDDPITPYLHTHAVIDFGKAFQSRSSRIFDYNGIHPHIRLIKATIEWKKACKYICKEDKTILLKASDQFNTVTSVWAHENLAQALEKCSLNEVIPTIALFNAKPLELPEPEISEDMFYDYQKTLWEKLQRQPNGRSIIWITDEPGNAGKTRFAQWCCLKHPGKAVMLNNIGKISDFAMNMQNFWNNGWRGDTVFLNLSRSYADKIHLYEAMEIIADGYITCTKYTGGVVWLPPLHIVVLSNFEPQYNRLSLDRWDCYTIKDRKLVKDYRRPPVTLGGGLFNPFEESKVGSI